MDSSRKAAWAAAFSLYAISCAHAATDGAARHFQVEAYRNDASVRQFVTYRFASAPTWTNGLVTDEAVIATCVRTALASKGMYEAAPGTVPDMEIAVNFRVEKRSEAASPFVRRFRPVTHRVRVIEVPVTDADGEIRRVPQEIVLPVAEGYVASSSERRTVTLFAKSLEISARAPSDPATARAQRELWRVRVSNKDQNGDTDAYARLMVSTASTFIAAETDGREDIVVNAGDERTLLARARD